MLFGTAKRLATCPEKLQLYFRGVSINLPKTAELPKMREEEEDEEDKGGENDTINIDNVNRNNVHNEIRKEYPRRFRRPVSEWRKY